MRPARSQLRRCALVTAFATSWTAAVQFEGCLGHPSRDLAADLSAGARQSAVEDIQRFSDKHQQPPASSQTVAAEETSSALGEEPSKVVAASGTESRFGFIRNALFPGRDTDKGSKSERPTSEAAESQAAESQSAVQSSQEPDVRPLTGHFHITQSESSKPFGREAAPADTAHLELPTAANTREKIATIQRTAEQRQRQEVFAQASQLSARSENSARNRESQSPAQRPLAENLAPQRTVWEPASAEPHSSAAAEGWSDAEATPDRLLDSPFTEFLAETSKSRSRTPSLQAQPRTAVPTRSEIAQGAVDDPMAPTQLMQHLRIRELMADVNRKVIRGDLQGAYRSALMAERLISECQMPLQPGEEHPREVAELIAERIWEASGTKPPQADSVPVPGGWHSLPTPGEKGPALAADESATRDGFTQWSAAPHAQANQPQSLELDGAPPRTAELPTFAGRDVLPGIHARGEWKTRDDAPPLALPTESVAASRQLATPNFSGVPNLSFPGVSEFEASGSESRRGSTASQRSGVQFAIVQTQSDLHPLPEPGTSSPLAGRYQRSELDSPRLPLPAPTGSAADPAAQRELAGVAPGNRNLTAPELMPTATASAPIRTFEAPDWDSLVKDTDANASGSRDAGTGFTKLQWLALSLMGGIITLLLGMRFLKKKRESQLDVLPMTASDSGADAAPESQAESRSDFQIKRAA